MLDAIMPYSLLHTCVGRNVAVYFCHDLTPSSSILKITMLLPAADPEYRAVRHQGRTPSHAITLRYACTLYAASV
jgi:hypothetical protein